MEENNLNVTMSQNEKTSLGDVENSLDDIPQTEMTYEKHQSFVFQSLKVEDRPQRYRDPDFRLEGVYAPKLFAEQNTL